MHHSICKKSISTIGAFGRKQVRFAFAPDGRVLTEELEAKCPLDESLWMSKEEWGQVRQSAQTVVALIQKGDAIWSQARRHSYAKTMSKSWKACVKGKDISKSLMGEINFWTSIGHTRRGLEKHSICDLQYARQKGRREHIAGIMFVQDQCSDHGMNFEETERVLRAASERLSSAATKFAAILATSDACAVDNDVDKIRAKLSTKFTERSRTLHGELNSKCVVNAAA